MYEYLKGKLIEITPTNAIVELNGIAYNILISLNTFSEISNASNVKLYVHQIIREDAHLLYGFSNKEERNFFKLLINISGIGPNTAQIILSSMKTNELTFAISTNNVAAFQKIKGIGKKTAERIIIELKDKITRISQIQDSNKFIVPQYNSIKEKALSALIKLGYTQKDAIKAIDKFIDKYSIHGKKEISLEQLIKGALSMF